MHFLCVKALIRASEAGIRVDKGFVGVLGCRAKDSEVRRNGRLRT